MTKFKKGGQWPTIVLMGGEGIGPEVVGSAGDVLKALMPKAEFVSPIHGVEGVAKFGKQIPDECANACKSADAVLFGTASDNTSDVIGFMRWGLQNFASVRPAKLRQGVYCPIKTKGDVDLVIVRECLEGEYPAREADLETFTQRWPGFKDHLGYEIAKKGKFGVRVTTEHGTKRICDVAVKTAEIRAKEKGRPGKVTIVTKANVLRQTDGMFVEIAQQTLKKAGVEYNELYIDEACRRLVISPERFDVILTPNLFGDIMSSITAELAGGIGVAPSGVTGGVSPYYESVHGSAPDIAGKGIANPLATILSAQMMLEDLNLWDQARALEKAVVKLLSDKKTLTPDLGGTASTNDVTKALIALL